MAFINKQTCLKQLWCMFLVLSCRRFQHTLYIVLIKCTTCLDHGFCVQDFHCFKTRNGSKLTKFWKHVWIPILSTKRVLKLNLCQLVSISLKTIIYLSLSSWTFQFFFMFNFVKIFNCCFLVFLTSYSTLTISKWHVLNYKDAVKLHHWRIHRFYQFFQCWLKH